MNIRGLAARTRGFTLIELLVVIAIIGLLASIIIVSLDQAQTKSRDARRVADIREIQNALEEYAATCGSFPAPLSSGAGLGIGDNNGCPSGTTLGTYISPVPADPRSGLPYAYTAFGSGATCSTYHLGAMLEISGGIAANDANAGPNSQLGVTPGSHSNCTNGGYVGGTAGNGTNTIAGSSNDFSGADPVYDVTP
jgi:general secretion pathway protein G